jgi:hypothetical protein
MENINLIILYVIVIKRDLEKYSLQLIKKVPKPLQRLEKRPKLVCHVGFVRLKKIILVIQEWSCIFKIF